MSPGALNATETVVLPAVAVPIVGTPGTVAVAGVMLLETAEAVLVPATFVATTVHVTAAPFVRPATMMGDPGPEALCAPHVAM